MFYCIEDLELLLLFGEEIDIGICKLYPLKLKEIVKLGYSKYNYYISLILIDKSILQNENTDLNDIDNFEVIYGLCNYDEQFKDNYFNMLELFSKETINLSDGFFYFGDLKENRIINKDNFDEIIKIIKRINFVKEQKKEEDYNPGNEEARKFIEEIKKKKELYAKLNKNSNSVTLYSISSSIAWKSHIGINSIRELTVYQLYDAYYRLGLIDNYDKTMHGIYAGTIDGKKIKLEEIDWSKVIDL